MNLSSNPSPPPFCQREEKPFQVPLLFKEGLGEIMFRRLTSLKKKSRFCMLVVQRNALDSQ
jgi:hypothetical protein